MAGFSRLFCCPKKKLAKLTSFKNIRSDLTVKNTWSPYLRIKKEAYPSGKLRHLNQSRIGT